jgi:Flp pilus assembly protein TadD
MNQFRKPPLALLALLSTLAALPIDALRSGLLAQISAEPTPTFTLQDSVAPGTTLTIDGSSSMAGLNQSLGSGFEQRYPDTDVGATTNGDEQALDALQGGAIDLAALGRSLSEAEQDPSLTSIPVAREKIAIIVGRDNPFQGDLTFESFAAIFRGEITSWSQVGGPNVPVRFVDRPTDSSTRLALADYEIFSGQPFETGETAVAVAEDDTAAVVRELGNDGISYAIASEVLDQDAVRPVSMHNTLPDDDRYPYSQPRNYIYRGEPSLPVEAFLGFATSAAGQTAIAAAQQTASDNVTVGASKLPGGVALAPDGSFMVRGGQDGQLQWLDAQGNPAGTSVAAAHRGVVSAVVVSPDGQTVVSSGADGTLRRWDRSGAPLGEPMAGQGGPILALALSPDGQTLASGSADGTIERWSLADGSALGAPIASSPVQALHYPAGGQALISGSSSGDLGFWNADGTPAGQSASAHQGGVTTITSSPDGQVLTTTGADGTLRNWDRSTLQPRGETIQAHDSAVSAVAYTPDGSTLATAGADGTLQLWNPDGTARLSEAIELDAPAASLGYTPEGQLVVGGSDREVELRDSQGDLVANGSAAADPDAEAPADADPATGLDSLWQRIRNLPLSAWWMLAAVPAVLLLAGIVGSLFGSKRDEGRDDDLDADRDDDEILEADTAPGPGLGIDFSAVGNAPITAGPAIPEAGVEVGMLPPEAELVPGDGSYSAVAAPSKLEQARIDLAEGRQLMREGRYDPALIYFDRAVEATEVERSKAGVTGVPAQGINAIAAQAQAQRGTAQALLGEADDAMESFNTSLELDSSVIEAWVGKGRLLSTTGRYEEAIFCFDTALELDQTAADAWVGKGQALAQMGRQTEAQACLARAAALGTGAMPEPGDGVSQEPGLPGVGVGPLGPEYGPEYGPGIAYDPDVPLELQQMVLGLPSADVEIMGSPPSSYDIPPALAAEAARLPDHAEDASSGSVTGAWPITAGPLPPETEFFGASVGTRADASTGAIAPEPISSNAITAGPLPPDERALGPLPSPLEDELISQIYLGAAVDLDGDLPDETDGATAPVDVMPPLRPAPVPVPPPVPLEPGDYVPPPPEPTTDPALAAENAVTDLAGLPPEVVAALASIPPGSRDSFGVAPASAEPAAAAEPEPASWIRLSVDREGDRFYAVWQIDGGDRARAKDQGGTTMTLRLYDVTGRATTAPLPEAVAEQLCRDDFAQDWYLPIPQWDRIYVVEVGYLSPDGDWQAIAQSAEVAAISP